MATVRTVACIRDGVDPRWCCSRVGPGSRRHRSATNEVTVSRLTEREIAADPDDNAFHKSGIERAGLRRQNQPPRGWRIE